MTKLERINMVALTISSLQESVGKFEAVQEKGEIPNPGFNISRNDGRESIMRRCQFAREQLARLMNEVKNYD